jgi:hypothetical protein
VQLKHLPKATYLIKKQAFQDEREQSVQDFKLHADLNEYEQAWKKNELSGEQIEEFRHLFHNTGEKKIWHHHAIPVNRNDHNEEAYYNPGTSQDLPAKEFMLENPQFMAPRHQYHKAKPLHSATPRPAPWNSDVVGDDMPDFLRENDFPKSNFRSELPRYDGNGNDSYGDDNYDYYGHDGDDGDDEEW